MTYETKREELQKTIDDLGFANSNINKIFCESNSVEGLILYPIMKEIAELKFKVEAFLNALESDQR